jgi:hypothetical protein
MPVQSQTVFTGQSLSLSVRVSGLPEPTYQWERNGVAIPGAATAAFVRTITGASDAGSYRVKVENVAGVVYSRASEVYVLPSSYISNLSVRTSIGAGQKLTVGAVVDGAKAILVRAAGPSLTAFGLSGVLDPSLELFGGNGAVLQVNDDWDLSLAPVFASVGAFAFPSNSKDAALNRIIDGPFTVQAKGDGGVLLVELYDVAGGVAPRLVNISARNRVGLGADVLIAGFTLKGTGAKTLLIRGVGPGLNQFGLTGTLSDPRIQVFDSANAVVVSNDNWDPSLATTFSSVGAFALPTGSRDAALVTSLRAGASYTVVVSGGNNGTGEALVEIYELP